MRYSSQRNPSISKTFAKTISHKGVRLLLVSFAGEPEVVDVYISAGGFRRIAEYRKARANEHARPVEAQREARADSAPRLSVGAPVHLGPVETSARGFLRPSSNTLFSSLMTSRFLPSSQTTASTALSDWNAASPARSPSFILETSILISPSHCGPIMRCVSVLRARKMFGATFCALSRIQPGRSTRLEPHPAWALNERPCAVERIVVPLPPEIKRLLFETV